MIVFYIYKSLICTYLLRLILPSECWEDEDEIIIHPHNASGAIHMTLPISRPAIKLYNIINIIVIGHSYYT